MRKVAIFVEGQSELIFVREFLLKWFDYAIDLECRALLSGEVPHSVPFDFPNQSAQIHFQVINVGMDGNVLSRILKREKLLYNAGYELIVGLRDMYSEAYKKTVKEQSVDALINQQFRKGTNETILKRAINPASIRFCFAIMELESWSLGIPVLWVDIDESVKEQYKICFSTPETVFHPAEIIRKLFESKQQTYKKRENQVESIVGKIGYEDFVELNSSKRCASFCEFVQHIES